MKKQQKVLAFGTFDGIHKGHIFFLSEAAKLGKLTVSVASDEVVKREKSKVPEKEIQRKKNIENLGIASKVIIGDEKIKTWNTIRKERPDIIAVGYDQDRLSKALREN